MGGKSRGVWALLALAAALMAGCDSGPSAVPARDHSAAALERAAAAARASQAELRGRGQNREQAEAPLYKGKPLWSANRRYTAQENAEYHFSRNGANFGAGTVDVYVAKAHAFVASPPKGALTLKRRNGDVLIYDPTGNVFAVANREGAPRTMFRPEDGMAYWERQKEKEAQGGGRSAGRNRDGGQG